MQEFELAIHKQDVKGQSEALNQCKQCPTFSAESMLKLAMLSKAASHSSADITREAFHAALMLLLAKGHAVQYDQVAQVCYVYVKLLVWAASCTVRCDLF